MPRLLPGCQGLPSDTDGGVRDLNSGRGPAMSSASTSRHDDIKEDGEEVCEIVGTEGFVAPEVLEEQCYSPAVE